MAKASIKKTKSVEKKKTPKSKVKVVTVYKCANCGKFTRKP